MAISVENLLRERKYPFIFSLLLLFSLVAVYLVATPSQPQITAADVTSLQHTSSRLSPVAVRSGNTNDVGESRSSDSNRNPEDAKNSEMESANDAEKPKKSDSNPNLDSSAGSGSENSAEKSRNSDSENAGNSKNSDAEDANDAGKSNSDSEKSRNSDSDNANDPEKSRNSESENANDTEKLDSNSNGGLNESDKSAAAEIDWKLCDGTVAVDYIPCLDNLKFIKTLKSRRHMEHRERHCPEKVTRCLVPMPAGYKVPVPWPKSRDMIWFNNVPHPKLVEYKKGQNWVRKSGDYFIFPGGGTQFKEGVAHYVDHIEKSVKKIEWGKRIRVILDVGCGVATFGGYLLDKNVITMSFAPKDEHEAQIQFALERGIPATLSVIGTQRLTYPDNAYDLIHCARCRVHWDADGGKPLMELNRILRPGGFFIWSATPVYRSDERDQNVWKSMVALTKAICWKVVSKSSDSINGIGLVVYQKPVSSACYDSREENNPPICDENSRPKGSWYVPLDGCIPRIPVTSKASSYKWPKPWPERLKSKPLSISSEPDAEETFNADTRHWSALVSDVYLGALAINWSSVRNVMDMNAGFGGFAAALIDQSLWVMNVVPVNGPDTLSIIFDRGLIGIYHDWCESLNTYPRTYDLLHSSFLFTNLTQRCDLIDVAVEIDRVLRPGGVLLVQDTMETIKTLSPVLRSLHWSVTLHQGQFLVGRKDFWRPNGKLRI